MSDNKQSVTQMMVYTTWNRNRLCPFTGFNSNPTLIIVFAFVVHIHYIPVNIDEVISQAKETSIDPISTRACLQIVVSRATITHWYKSNNPKQIHASSVLINNMANFPKTRFRRST